MLAARAPLKRAQAATLLVRATDVLGVALPSGDLDGFDDVPVDAAHAQAIADLAASGVLDGYDGVSFGPGAPLTRGQMASAIERLLRHLADDASPVA